MSGIDELRTKPIQQMSISEYARLFQAEPKLALDRMAQDRPNTFRQSISQYLNCGESDAEKLERIQKNGSAVLTWEEKQLLEQMAKMAVVHEMSKHAAAHAKEKLEEELEHLNESSGQGHGTGLPGNLASLSHGEQVHHIAELFMHGGSVDDLVKNKYLTSQEAENIKNNNKAIKEKVDAEWQEKEAARREELRRQGLSEMEVEARLKQEQAEHAKKRQAEEAKRKEEEAIRNGQDRQASVWAAQAQAISNGMTIAQDGNLEKSSSVKMAVQNSRASEAQFADETQAAIEAKKRLEDGISVSNQDLNRIKSLEHLNIKEKSARMEAQRADADRLALSAIKKDSDALSKTDALDAMNNGVLTKGKIENAQVAEQYIAKETTQEAQKKSADYLLAADDDQPLTAKVPELGRIQLSAWQQKQKAGAEAPAQSSTRKASV